MPAGIQASTHASRQARRQPRSAKVEKSKSSCSRRARRGRSTATQNTSPRLARAVVVVAAGRQARLMLTALLVLPRSAFAFASRRVQGSIQNLRKPRRGASFNHLGHSLFALPPPAGAAMPAGIQASTHASRQARMQPRSAKVEKSRSSFSRRARRDRSTATQNTSPRLARAVVVAAGRQARHTALRALPRFRVPRSRSRRDA